MSDDRPVHAKTRGHHRVRSGVYGLTKRELFAIEIYSAYVVRDSKSPTGRKARAAVNQADLLLKTLDETRE